ncbi:MAG: AHH domain-containing protein, partial [Bacteroidota bacterium]
GVNAILSFSAMVPFGGWAASGAKFAMKTIDVANGGKTTLKWAVKTDDVVVFGNRNQLARVLGTKGTGKHAHHIIPWEMGDHLLVQKAAKSSKEFHMNEALNGISLPSSSHLTGHSQYNAKIRSILDRMNLDVDSYDDAYNQLDSFIDYLSNLIQSNQGKSLGEIATLIDY